MKSIPYGHQSIEQSDINAVLDVLSSDWLTQGPMVNGFEESLAAYCQSQYAVAVCNGTAALHVAYLALGLGPNDSLWTVPNTFVATANAALFCGAKVDFVDIDPNTYNLCPDALETKLKAAAVNNALPKIVVPVHFAGQSCNMERIRQLADQYQFKIVEDACHAIGGQYNGLPIGNCQYADLTVFSFHPVKVMTMGEGGAVLTNDIALAEKMRCLRSHGVIRNDALTQSEGAWYYQQQHLGFNYRVTDIQCALGVAQLKKVDRFVERRNILAKRYCDLLSTLPVKLPEVSAENYSAYHLFVIQVEARKAVFDFLRQANIQVNVHYIPVHTQPYYQQLGFRLGDYPHAESYYSQAITLPLFYDLSERDQDYIVEQVKLGIRHASTRDTARENEFISTTR